jgi:hypothetical protein
MTAAMPRCCCIWVRAPRSDSAVIAKPSSEEEVALFDSIRATLKRDPKWYSTRLAAIRGVSEETTTGVKRLYQMARDGSSPSRPSTSTTRSPSRSSTTCMAAANRWWTASSAPPT